MRGRTAEFIQCHILLCHLRNLKLILKIIIIKLIQKCEARVIQHKHQIIRQRYHIVSPRILRKIKCVFTREIKRASEVIWEAWLDVGAVFVNILFYDTEIDEANLI